MNAVSTIADRFNILTQAKQPISLSAQVLINCQAGGTCNGGDPSQVYQWAFDYGLVHSSCEQYEARNLFGRKCEPFDICRDCAWPVPTEFEDGLDTCFPVTPDIRYYVSQYYHVAGVEQMKSEIFNNGPISCGIQATEKFKSTYSFGIYSEFIELPVINHEVSVVGFGFDLMLSQEYWIVRNSWGTHWGE